MYVYVYIYIYIYIYIERERERKRDRDIDHVTRAPTSLSGDRSARQTKAGHVKTWLE